MRDPLRGLLRGIGLWWWGLIATSTLLPGALFLIVVWKDYNLIFASAQREVEQNVENIREHAVGVFRTAELVSELAEVRLGSLTWGEIEISPRIHRELSLLHEHFPQIKAISLFDAAGNLRNSSQSFPAAPFHVESLNKYANVTRSDADHRVETAELEGLLAEPHFNFVRTLRDDRGSVVISISTAVFADLWRKAFPFMTSDVVAEDLRVLARVPSSPQRQLRPIGPVRAALDAGQEMTFRGITSLDGLERVFAFRRVPHFGLYVVSGVEVRLLMARWYEHMRVYGSLFGAAALALLTLALIAYDRAKKAQVAMAQQHEFERFELLGRAASGFAHDFGNAFTAILLGLERLRGQILNPKLANTLDAAILDAECGAKAVQSLLLFARKGSIQVQTFAVNDLIQRIRALLRQVFDTKTKLEIMVPEDTWTVATDPAQLELALLNLAVNARDAMPKGGTFRVAAANVHLSGTPAGLYGDFVALSVTDNGAGMSNEVLSRAIEPFFTTKEKGQGAGLGLSRVYALARESGGTLVIDSAVGHGTSITIYLKRGSERESPQDRTDHLQALLFPAA